MRIDNKINANRDLLTEPVQRPESKSFAPTPMHADEFDDLGLSDRHLESTRLESPDVALSPARQMYRRCLRKFQSTMKRLATESPARFRDVLTQAYGAKIDETTLARLLDQARAGAFPFPSRISTATKEDLGGHDGAYSPEDGGTIYVSKDVAERPRALFQVIMEEAGHHLDRVLGGADAKGDEGEIFRKGVLADAPLLPLELEMARADQDTGAVTIDAKTQDVEFFGQFAKTPIFTSPIGHEELTMRGALAAGFSGKDAAAIATAQRRLDVASEDDQDGKMDLIEGGRRVIRPRDESDTRIQHSHALAKGGYPIPIALETCGDDVLKAVKERARTALRAALDMDRTARNLDALGRHDEAKQHRDEALRYLGLAVHNVQDSYSEAHVMRQKLGDPHAPIVAFQVYPYTHECIDSRDAIWTDGEPDRLMGNLKPSALAATEATRELLEAYRTGSPAAVDQAVEKIFTAAPDGVKVHGPGLEQLLRPDKLAENVIDAGTYVPKEVLRIAGLDFLIGIPAELAKKVVEYGPGTLFDLGESAIGVHPEIQVPVDEQKTRQLEQKYTHSNNAWIREWRQRLAAGGDDAESCARELLAQSDAYLERLLGAYGGYNMLQLLHAGTTDEQQRARLARLLRYDLVELSPEEHEQVDTGFVPPVGFGKTNLVDPVTLELIKRK
ncbi:MAG: hypothetical protein HYV63_33765 [Candidatus Schekmanbacteria bacterium]|nr:hypothetical protein [Candidatus Schekmanbacteria bacterium]